VGSRPHPQRAVAAILSREVGNVRMRIMRRRMRMRRGLWMRNDGAQPTGADTDTASDSADCLPADLCEPRAPAPVLCVRAPAGLRSDATAPENAFGIVEK